METEEENEHSSLGCCCSVADSIPGNAEATRRNNFLDKGDATKTKRPA
jgi:hypothetical protein